MREDCDERSPSNSVKVIDCCLDNEDTPLKHSNVDSNLSTVLVVDDEPINLSILQSMLLNIGIESETASNGQQAIEQIERRLALLHDNEAAEKRAAMFKLVLLDYSLGDEMNGPQIARKIIELFKHETAERPYICCCSAYTEKSYSESAIEAGMDDFMTKPLTGDGLVHLLQITKII